MAVVKSHTLLGFKTNTLMKACCGSGNGPFNFNMHNECGEERVTTCSHRASRSHLVCFLTTTIQEADLLQVATVIGLEEEVEVTDDIGIADTILASSTEIKQNPWIRSIAKLHQVPAFVVKEVRLAIEYIYCHSWLRGC